MKQARKMISKGLCVRSESVQFFKAQWKMGCPSLSVMLRCISLSLLSSLSCPSCSSTSSLLSLSPFLSFPPPLTPLSLSSTHPNHPYPHANSPSSPPHSFTPGLLGLKKGGVIMARRKWRAGSAWGRGNIKQMWMPAEILKVRSASTEEKETYDVSEQ
jgi:hypothetical protein